MLCFVFFLVLPAQFLWQQKVVLPQYKTDPDGKSAAAFLLEESVASRTTQDYPLLEQVTCVS